MDRSAPARPATRGGRRSASCWRSRRSASRWDGAEGRLLRRDLVGREALRPDVLLRPALPLHRSWPRRGELALLRRLPGPDALPGDGVPGRHRLLAYAAARVTQVLAGSPDLEARKQESADSLFGQPDVQREIRIFVIVHALLFAALALLSAWLLAGVNRRRPWDAAMFALSPALALTFLINWDMLAVVLVAGGAVVLGARAAGPDRGADRARDRDQALSAVPARRAAGDLSAGAALARADRRRPGRASPRGWSSTRRRSSRAASSGRSSGASTPSAPPTWAASGWSLARPATGPSRRTRSTCGRRALFGVLVRRRRAARLHGADDPAARPARRSSSSPASCSSTRSTHRSTCCGCCRSRCWPGPRGATRSSGRPARSSTSPRCGGTSTATSPRWRPGRRLLLAGDRDPGRGRALSVRDGGARHLVAAARPGACHRLASVGARRAGSDDLDAVERRRGVAHPRVDRVADRGHRRSAGRNSIEACMCGGSAKSRCSPSTQNGERTLPAASRPPRATVAARSRRLEPLIGDSRPMPCAVPPLTTSRWPSLGAGRPR